jgi:hypothetical protein
MTATLDPHAAPTLPLCPHTARCKASLLDAVSEIPLLYDLIQRREQCNCPDYTRCDPKSKYDEEERDEH